MVTHRFATARNTSNTTRAAADSPAPFVVLAPATVMAMGWGGGMAAIYEEAYRRAQAIVLARQASARIGRDIVFATASARPLQR